MRSTFAPVAFAALAAAIPNPVPQAVTSAISPSSSAPSGCSDSYSGTFEIQVVNVTSSSSKRDIQKRQTDDSTLTLSLSGGILTDSNGRTGYIASNNQFQFDKPPQAGAIYTAGWSACSNGSMALGGDSVFYQCLSGTFYNLYDESEGAQCNEVTINVIGGASGSSAAPASSSAAATEQSDGQPTASPVSSPVSQISDGQPQATTGGAVSQISDGQPQATTGAAVSQLSDGQPQATTGAAVSQLSDGQPQATTGAAVSQISDGQPQATTGAAVTQLSDGQPEATTGAVSQISDGQPQAPTGANSTIASPTATVQPYTGGAVTTAVRAELFGLAAGVLAIALL